MKVKIFLKFEYTKINRKADDNAQKVSSVELKCKKIYQIERKRKKEKHGIKLRIRLLRYHRPD